MSDELRKKIIKLKEEIPVEDEDIKEVIALTIELANRMLDIGKLKEMFGIKESRSMLVKIIDVKGGGEVGFIIDETNSIRPVRGLEKATTYVEITKDVFWALATRKLDPYDCWLYDLCKVRGEYSLRDVQLLYKIFTAVYDYVFGGENESK
ncbi:MAG: hypothetical protein LZ173_02105 [Thaumarchaeota archaeon]|nr:hypothetical protein [Candidatus Geocrenenecus arthurdayi]